MQYRRAKRRKENIQYITNKLRDLSVRNTQENLLLVTDQHDLKELLIEINRLLDQQTYAHVQFSRKERSIKKMLANISHDLKTPLTVVLGYIETIQKESTMPNKEKNRLLKQVNHKTLEIIQMMNTFFDLAKLESGDKEIPLARINISEVCKNNILAFYDLIDSKDLEAIVNIPETPIFVWGNEDALNRVLHNLLSNAIHYGNEGQVIGISLTYEAKQVQIEVWDKGRGIPETEQDRVFERMFTLEESRNKSYQGSGLGLTITKRLVEEMGGTITMTSTPFKKTAFTIMLTRITY